MVEISATLSSENTLIQQSHPNPRSNTHTKNQLKKNPQKQGKQTNPDLSSKQRAKEVLTLQQNKSLLLTPEYNWKSRPPASIAILTGWLATAFFKASSSFSGTSS